MTRSVRPYVIHVGTSSLNIALKLSLAGATDVGVLSATGATGIGLDTTGVVTEAIDVDVETCSVYEQDMTVVG